MSQYTDTDLEEVSLIEAANKMNAVEAGQKAISKISQSVIKKSFEVFIFIDKTNH